MLEFPRCFDIRCDALPVILVMWWVSVGVIAFTQQLVGFFFLQAAALLVIRSVAPLEVASALLELVAPPLELAVAFLETGAHPICPL